MVTISWVHPALSVQSHASVERLAIDRQPLHTSTSGGYWVVHTPGDLHHG
jgi:hypothetical protein